MRRPDAVETATAAVEDVVEDVVETVPPAPALPSEQPDPDLIAETVAAAETSTPAVTSSAPAAVVGTHVVQVAALRSREEADQAWGSLERKLGDFLSGKSPDILSPTSADDIYYRLRVGPFTSRDDAATFCEGLKSRDQGCMVRTK